MHRIISVVYNQVHVRSRAVSKVRISYIIDISNLGTLEVAPLGDEVKILGPQVETSSSIGNGK